MTRRGNGCETSHRLAARTGGDGSDEGTTDQAQRLRVGVALALLGASVFTFAPTNPASAYCRLGDEYTLTYSLSWGREEGYGDPQCGSAGWAYPYGNNGHYRGRVRDMVTDGSCVSVRYSDGSYNGVQASSCDSAGIVYHFYDQTGDYASYFRLERNQGPSSWVYTIGY